MQLPTHTARNYADAFAHLLPPGLAWDWPQDSLGDNLLLALAQELARLDTKAVIDAATARHQPVLVAWHMDDYRAAAGHSNIHTVTPFTTSSTTDDRLFSYRAKFLLQCLYASNSDNIAVIVAAIRNMMQAHIVLLTTDTTGTDPEQFYAAS